MSLPNYLAKIKSSGIYRFVWDKSEVTSTEAETLRLVVGYSEKGPFNTPVYVETVSDFKTIFGDVNKKLERRGVFFHRMCIQALAGGPILALNLKPFEDEQVKAIGYNNNVNSQQVKLIDIYNTSRFWSLDPDKLAEASGLDNSYITIAAADELASSNSIFFRPWTSNTDGYDITLKSWYTDLGIDMPEYLLNYSDYKVKDFLAEIYVFKGEFTKAIASSPELEKYFDVSDGTVKLVKSYKDAFGKEVDVLDALAENENSGFIQKYSGCLLPEFKNTTSLYMSLDLVFNADYNTHKMIMKLNSNMIYDDESNVLKSTTSIFPSLTVSHIENSAKEAKQNSEITTWTGVDILGCKNIKPDTIVYYPDATGAEKKYKKSDVTEENAELFTYDFTTSSPGDITYSDNHVGIKSSFAITESKKFNIGQRFMVNVNTAEGADQKAGIATLTRKTYTETGETYLDSDETANFFPINAVDKGYYRKISDKEVYYTTNESTNNIVIKGKQTKYTPSSTESLIKDNAVGAVVDKYYIFDNKLSSDNYFIIGKVTEYDSTTQKATFDGNDMYKFTRISDISKSTNIDYTTVETFTHDGVKYTNKTVFNKIDYTDSKTTRKFSKEDSDETVTLYFDKPIRLLNITYDESEAKCLVYCNKGSVDTANATLSPEYLEGYTYGTVVKPTSQENSAKLAYQNNILSILDDDNYQLIEAMTNRTDVDYRYIVDTFETFPSSGSIKIIKQRFAEIAKKKDNCLLLTNFPSMKTLLKEDEFKEDLKNIKSYITLPDADQGASWCSFNTPVVITDGTIKTTVPAAALVSNNFMAKYAGRQPYYIVAGPTYGRLTYAGLVGPDYNFTRAQLDILEPMGVNATVYVPRKGTFINSNQTAKQTPVTALSKIHVRELVIYLQDQIEDLLQNYQWEFNTDSLRNLIKAKADSICENIQANHGIYAFYNVCDSSNNTDEVIDNEMIILDTAIEPTRGAGKMVQQLTIHKTGGISSTITGA